MDLVAPRPVPAIDFEENLAVLVSAKELCALGDYAFVCRGDFFLMVQRRIRVTSLILFLWAVYPLIYYIVISSERYRYPMLWTSLLPAGYFLEAAWQIWRRIIAVAPATTSLY